MSPSHSSNDRPYTTIAILGALVGLTACGTSEETTELVYQAVSVETRDIVVSAEAAGVIEPDTLVEVKSKASGEILDIRVETGQKVERGDLLIRVDQRTPTNALAQSQANLDVALARLENATSQKNRAEELFQSRSITETEYEATMLDFANAKAEVVRAEVQVDNDRIRLDDTDVRAPTSGTIIEKQVERGQVISSPTQDVGGGTVLLMMADLNLVQVRTLVDETDIGKIKAGQATTVTVAAYPTQPFQGEVVKIEPQAVQQQNVTMFPVLIRIRNRDDLLRPGMNAEVEIHIGRRDGVLAVPNASLRTQRDVNSAAMVLGLSPDDVREQLAADTRATQRTPSSSRAAPSRFPTASPVARSRRFSKSFAAVNNRTPRKWPSCASCAPPWVGAVEAGAGAVAIRTSTSSAAATWCSCYVTGSLNPLTSAPGSPTSITAKSSRD
jgi:HlyD family secretion protein